ncbi:MAG: sigma-70 family RNA polymerase sigma factor [Planctomycetaceae bacterium]
MSESTLHVRLCGEPPAGMPLGGWLFAAGQTVRIGRHAENDVVLKSSRVSRFHLTLFHDGQRWQCASVGANGTNCDGQPVSHVALPDSSVLELGPPGPKLQIEVLGGDPDENVAGTISLLIDGMKQGDVGCFERLWARCFATIVQLARQRLGTARKRVEDEEDVAAVVFQKLYFASVQGKLPELTDRQSLWRLLLTMTRNAALDSINREQRAKRGGGHVRGESIVEDPRLLLPNPGPSAFDNFVGTAPTPGSVASVNELLDQWLDRLPDDESRQVALLHLEGFSPAEIANQLGLSKRTSERRLKQIRAAWSG